MIGFASRCVLLVAIAGAFLACQPQWDGLTADPATGLSDVEYAELRDYALGLINDARTDAGLNRLVLDDNGAAQFHAVDMRVGCTRGHWGTDGLKPYMRYTRAGGEQYSAENVFAIDFCPADADRFAAESPVEQIDYALGLFMDSPGHRENILNPHHRKVGIGLTYRRPTIWFVQLFVGDYIEYAVKPKIESGTLSMSGSVKNGADVSGDSLSVTVYYGPPPEPLTRGQLSRTYCYGNGERIARLRRPLGSGSSYSEDEITVKVTSKPCPDPYDIPAEAPPPMSADAARSNWEQARDASREVVGREVTFPWITADQWAIDGDTFNISADISDLINRHGDGVYTILLSGNIDGQRAPISEYSIFVAAKR